MKFQTRIGLRVMLAMSLMGLAINSAHAQYFSNHDGYTNDGNYRVQIELSPYLWLPATSGHIGFSRAAVANHISGDFSSGVPTIGDLASTLHFSFMGAGLVRYGPYSGELDLQYVYGSQSNDLPSGPRGGSNRIYASVSYVRVAPGIGYEVYTGNVDGVPVSVDVRVGFAYFVHSEKLKGEEDLTGQVTGSGDFVQPWFGGRLDIIPAPQWRIELGALAQGLGVSGGSWGWGASLIGAYAFSDLFSADAGFRALGTDRNGGNLNTKAASNRTLSVTAYGPVFGVTLRF
jgi:hypothetical protein